MRNRGRNSKFASWKFCPTTHKNICVKFYWCRLSSLGALAFWKCWHHTDDGRGDAWRDRHDQFCKYSEEIWLIMWRCWLLCTVLLFWDVYGVHQLDQKGSELHLVDTYGQLVNSAAITQLRQVSILCAPLVWRFGLVVTRWPRST